MKAVVKRLFDILVSFSLIILFFWVLLVSWLLAAIDTHTNGVFIQERIGQYGKRFKIYKLRTIQKAQGSGEFKISRTGRILRNFKLDELPQLFNVLKGEMSIVGPRPDIAGYYDVLEGENRQILELKPGLTSLASLKYYNEEVVLQKQALPLQYNDEVIFPDKLQLNLDYYYKNNIGIDIQIIIKTIDYMFLKRRL